MPIFDFAIANEGLKDELMDKYYSCCGKKICRGCMYSFWKSGNDKCPFCNSDRDIESDKVLKEVLKRVEANDANALFMLGNSYYHELNGLQQDQTKAMELYARAADLGCSEAHRALAVNYQGVGDLKKTKFHFEAAAMLGNEVARCNLGLMETHFRNRERAIKHFIIAASAGDSRSLNILIPSFQTGRVSREKIDSTLAAYNSSCAEMRSEARDTIIRFLTGST